MSRAISTEEHMLRVAYKNPRLASAERAAATWGSASWALMPNIGMSLQSGMGGTLSQCSIPFVPLTLRNGFLTDTQWAEQLRKWTLVRSCYTLKCMEHVLTLLHTHIHTHAQTHTHAHTAEIMRFVDELVKNDEFADKEQLHAEKQDLNAVRSLGYGRAIAYVKLAAHQQFSAARFSGVRLSPGLWGWCPKLPFCCLPGPLERSC